jgi:DNA (cytosine-5)-methyltransferase 1
MTSPKLLDLFCGAGGMSLGAARAGFNLVAGVDFDGKALSAHSLNFPNSKHLQLDISKILNSEILPLIGEQAGQVDVIVGGPPCQGFSSIGKRDLDDTRNQLISHFFRIVAEIKPRAFLMENVPGVLHKNYTALLDIAMAPVLEGYTILAPYKLRATEAGAPTIRQRVLIVGFRKDCDEQANGFWERLELKKLSAPTIKDALDGLPLDVDSAPKTPSDKIQRVNVVHRGHFFERVTGKIPEGVGHLQSVKDYLEQGLVTGCVGTAHSPEITARYGALLYGQQDSKTKSVRLNPDGYCPTLRAGTGPEKGSFQAVRPIHYLRPRVITPREAARLQGFPDWYQFDETKWHAFRQIGNSVSPHVSELVISQIKSALGI